MPHADPEVAKAYHRAKYLRNREKILARVKSYRLANLKSARVRGWKNQLQRLYGVDDKVYDAMFKSQNGQCAICNTTVPGERTKRFCVDHCHQSGKIRGLLCFSCNVWLGKTKENAALILSANYKTPSVRLKAISYLLKQELQPSSASCGL